MIMARMSARSAAFVAAFMIWAAVAASAVFWALRLWSTPIATPAHATVVAGAGAHQGDLARVLGSDAAKPTGAAAAAPADARFKLVGVVAPRAPGSGVDGVALIATDGKPAKAYRVGSAIDDGLVLQAVQTRAATLGPRGQPAQLELQLPVLPPPSSGPSGAARPDAAAGRTFAPPLPQAVPQPALPPAGGSESGDDEPQPLPRTPAIPDRPPG
jgi:general secretion pathway protein C